MVERRGYKLLRRVAREQKTKKVLIKYRPTAKLRVRAGIDEQVFSAILLLQQLSLHLHISYLVLLPTLVDFFTLHFFSL